MSKGSEPVHINDLPQDIIREILMKLSIQEAVKTSVLSSNWRYTWTGLTELVFDDSFCEKSIMKTKSRLVMAIYQVLLLHHGPLHMFTLRLSNLDTSSGIDQFLLVALRKGIKDLMIEIKKGEPYSLPSSIFEYGQQLEILDLSSCVFKSPCGFKGFSILEKMKIEKVDICGNRLSGLISNCPLLRWLVFCSSTSTGCFDIVAPNLEYLHLNSYGMSICFQNTPRLAEVVICTEEVSVELESESFFLSGSLPVVQKLILDDFYLKCYHLMFSTAPNSLVTDVSRVKTLTLWFISFGVLDEVIYALSLIRNIPNLEKLTFNVSNPENALDVEFIEMEDFSDVSLGCLREVKFLEASGLWGELQFIKLILAKSPVLEKFLVEVDSNLACKEKLKFCKKLTKFRRASTLARDGTRNVKWGLLNYIKKILNYKNTLKKNLGVAVTIL